jgi:hypothetical protein
MSEPRPILEDNPSVVEQRLIVSARFDRPPLGGKQRILVAMGFGAGTATVGGAATAATAPALGIAVISKWLAVGLATGALTTGALLLGHQALGARRASPPAVLAPALRSLPRKTATLPVTSSVTKSSDSAPRSSEGTAHVHSRPRSSEGTAHVHSRPRTQSSAPTRANAPPAVHTPTLSDEVTALDRVRQAALSGTPTNALRLLDTYERTFNSPNLAPEAAVLRIEALLALRRETEAKRVGERLLASNPNTPHAQRVRSLLGGLSGAARKSGGR